MEPTPRVARILARNTQQRPARRTAPIPALRNIPPFFFDTPTSPHKLRGGFASGDRVCRGALEPKPVREPPTKGDEKRTAQKLVEGYETLPLPVQNYIQAGVLRIAYTNERGKLAQSASTVAINDKKKLKRTRADINEMIKALKETGKVSLEASTVTALYSTSKALSDTIKDKENKAGCGPKQKGEFTDAIAILQAQEVEILETEIIGHKIEAKPLSHNMMAKVEEYRATKRKEKREAKQKPQ